MKVKILKLVNQVSWNGSKIRDQLVGVFTTDEMLQEALKKSQTVYKTFDTDIVEIEVDKIY